MRLWKHESTKQAGLAAHKGLTVQRTRHENYSTMPGGEKRRTLPIQIKVIQVRKGRRHMGLWPIGQNPGNTLAAQPAPQAAKPGQGSRLGRQSGGRACSSGVGIGWCPGLTSQAEQTGHQTRGGAVSDSEPLSTTRHHGSLAKVGLFPWIIRLKSLQLNPKDGIGY